jgi:hypothetical protein
METMSHPCFPLIPFPTQYEESSYLGWSRQVAIACPPENGHMYDAHLIPSPDEQKDDEFMDMLIKKPVTCFKKISPMVAIHLPVSMGS